jgi:hypothetical protein
VVAALSTVGADIVAVGLIRFVVAAGLGAWVPKFCSFATPRALQLNAPTAG